MLGHDRLVRSDAPPSPAISLVHSAAQTTREIPSDAGLTTRVRRAAWSILPLAGMVEALFSRHTMNPDGVSYLDMGDAIVRGDWKMAVNGYWSPLYPWIQGTALRLAKPSTFLQFSVVHFVNFLIFLFAFACFDLLLQTAVTSVPWLGESENRRLPRWAVFAVGYSVFLWSSIALTRIRTVSPDMLMTGLLYLAVALLLKIWARPQSYSRFALLGAVLGLGYLAKVAVFPLCGIFLAVAWIVSGNWRKATPRVLAAVLVFAVVSGPWIAALSKAKGRFTFGDSGRVNYMLWVDGASPSYYFRDLGAAGGQYAHPIRQIYDAPAVYEFSTPVKGTLPVWYDASYWTDGAVPKLSLRNQVAVIRGWLHFYFDLLFSSQSALFVGFVVLCFVSGRYLFFNQVKARWPIWLIGVAGLAMFAIVHVELRYVAPFFTLCWVGLFSGLKMPRGREGQRLVALVTLAVVIGTAGPTIGTVFGHLSRSLGAQPNEQWEVAENLRGLGVAPGDRVARIGGGFGVVYWARLLGVTEVAEVPLANSKEFWSATPEVQAEVIQSFQRLGVKAVVADMSDQQVIPGPEWRLLGGRLFALTLAPKIGQPK